MGRSWALSQRVDGALRLAREADCAADTPHWRWCCFARAALAVAASADADDGRLEARVGDGEETLERAMN